MVGRQAVSSVTRGGKTDRTESTYSNFEGSGEAHNQVTTVNSREGESYTDETLNEFVAFDELKISKVSSRRHNSHGTTPWVSSEQYYDANGDGVCVANVDWEGANNSTQLAILLFNEAMPIRQIPIRHLPNR